MTLIHQLNPREGPAKGPLGDVLDALDQAIATTEAGDRPGLVVALAARLARLGAGMVGPPSTPESVCEEERLLTLPEVARRLGVPEEHARELGRRNELPTVQVGRYVRVRPEDLRAFVGKRRIPLDPGLYTRHSGSRGRRESAADLESARTDAAGLLRAPRGHRQHGRQVGAERSPHHGADGEAHPPGHPAGQG
jgi:excisionase family DNA binding protein